MNDVQDLLRARYGALPFEPPAEIAPALSALLDRRVTRRYRDEAIPDPLLSTVLAGAQSAPSKSDLQQYSIIVLRDRAKIAAIAGWIGTMPWIADAPVLLIFCGDLNRGRRLGALYGRENANDNMDSFLNASVDAALAMGFTIMAADAAGLGTCPISYVRNHLEKIGPMLKLPKGVFPVAGLTLGWPVARNEPSPRLPQNVVVHQEVYDDSGLEAALPAYDALRPPANPRYPEVFGPAKENWSANASRQLGVPERAGFRAWLRHRGFALD
ncbi:NADPH-dependent oxidoreductase [Rhodovarius crocodyli]|uniref:NADPH-dependent oxidoreductase n=1 Tax=Rhodovarius crocodyli TaxID=1979269 RepID=A0A437MNI7_9PROT|nr:nitroreductase family protein [Rhodovarius crocodyli]RVT99192.1 NADPH-dependent oxidoreductase [Rhodovarius crocodyli]